MQQKRKVFGVTALTLSEVVDELADATGNDNRSHYFSTLNHAKNVWEKLLRKSIWGVMQKVVRVPENGVIAMPKGMDRLLAVTIVDRGGERQSVFQDPAMNTMEIECGPSDCTCSECNGNDTLCQVLDAITYRTEDVVIDSVTYQKRIWNRKDIKGNLLQVAESPAFNVGSGEVEYTLVTDVLCALEVNKNCCILRTAKNRSLLRDHCGPYITGCEMLNEMGLDDDYRGGNPDTRPVISDYGYWNWKDAVAQDKIVLRYSAARMVILSYQGDSDCEDEILIPNYAKETMLLGILHRRALFNPNASIGERKAAKAAFESERRDMRRYLNPISMEFFARFASEAPLW